MNISQSAVDSLLVPMYYLRESEKTESLDSQELRTIAAIETVLRNDPLCKSFTISPYPTTFKSRQVNRDDVLSTTVISDMILALHDNLPDLSAPRPTNKKTTVWIVAVSLLRFGKKKEQLQAIVDALAGISDKLEVEIMPLDCFGIPMDKAIPILTDYIDELEKISRVFGTQFDQGKNVMADAHFHGEQSFVSSKAGGIKKRLKQGDVALKAMIERGLKLVREVDSAEGTVEGDGDAGIINITIAYTMGRDRFVERYLEALKRIKACSKVGEDLSSYINKQVQSLAEYVHDYKGTKLTGMYFRKSPMSSSRVLLGVPVDQFAMSVSDMKYYHQDIKLEERNIAIFFDDSKTRTALANPKYISYFTAILAGVFDDVYITLPARINQDAKVIALHDAACKFRRTNRHFTKAIGKDVNMLTDMEEERNNARKEAKKTFIEKIEQCRKENLPPCVDAKAGNVTYELSTAMKVLGSLKLRKEEMSKNGNNDGQNRGIDSDEDSIGSDCVSEYSESESDDEEEDDKEETGHPIDQN